MTFEEDHHLTEDVKRNFKRVLIYPLLVGQQRFSGLLGDFTKILKTRIYF